MNHNETWASAIIDQLVRQGIDQFYLAPGYRSTSLALAVENHPSTAATVFFDERALGFMALGYAKAKGRPCAIITTSGTAVANLYPAVIEAYASHTPLVILTADRPYEMLDCGQNQTIEQTGIFSSYTCHTLNLPAIEKTIDTNYLQSALTYAIHASKRFLSPVHINCPFRKPFYAESINSENKKDYSGLLGSLFSSAEVQLPNYFVPNLTLSNLDLQSIKKICEQKEGLIILSELPLNTDLSSILALSQKLGWPIFADPMSKIHRFKNRPNVIEHFELILKSKKVFSPKVILQFGNRFISQTLLDFLKDLNAEHIHIAPYSSCYDPNRKISYHIEADPFLVAKNLNSLVDQKKESSLATNLKKWDLKIKNDLEGYFKKNENLTEGSIIYYLAKVLPSCSIFFANSMPIRNCLQYFHPSKEISVFTNRGASGIDGNLSTTIGIAESGNKKPFTLGLIGDQATLHDLNALAAAKTKNLHFMIFNNYGGGIFANLPIANKKNIFEKYFQAKHSMNFECIAKQFDLDYINITSKEEFENLNFNKLPTFIECTTSTKIDLLSEKEIMDKICDEYAANNP